MRTFIFAFIVFFSLLSPAVADSGQVPSECGMEQAADGTLKVKTADPTICEDDLAFMGLYIMFSDVFQDATIKPFALWFVDEAVMDSEFVNFVDEALPVSGGIYTMLTATALIAWTVLGVILAIKTFKYSWQFYRTGKKPFSQSTGDDGMKMMIYLGVLIFLAAPVGTTGGAENNRTPIMMGQAIGVLLSLPATNVGNMGYSTYLSSTQMASSDTGVNDDALLLESQPVSNALITSQVCQVNTSLATFNMLSTAESGYFARSFWGVGDVGFDTLDQEHILNRFDECTGYHADAEAGSVNDTISSLMFNKSSFDYRTCQGSNYNYEPETFGYGHNCSTVSYNLGENKFTSIMDNDHSERGEDNDDLVEELQDSIDPGTLFRIFRANLLTPMRSLMRQTDLSPQERFNRAQDLIFEEAEVLRRRGLTNELLSSGTVEERQLFHLYAAVTMLGGKVRNYSELENFTDTFQWMEERQAYPAIHYPTPVEGVFWFEMLNDEARKIAELIREYHCAVTWEDHTDARQFIIAFNQNDDAEALRGMFDGGKVPFQCIRILPEGQWGIDTDTRRYMTYHLDHADAFGDLRRDDSGNWLFDVNNKQGIAEIAERMRSEVAESLQMEIKVRQLILAGYVAAVKKSVSDNLKDSASDIELDSIRDVSLRGMGWGVLGGALLYTGQTQTSSRHMGSSFQNIITVGSGEIEENGINMAAFGEDMTDEQAQLVASRFGSLQMERFLSVGAESAAVRSTFRNSETASEEEAMQTFLRYMEYLFLSPISHIKEASGMPVDRSLGDGLRYCFENGADSCLSGGKHPITALSHFGNEMLNNGLSLMVGLIIVDGLFGDEGMNVERGSMKGSKGDSSSFLKTALKFIVKVVGGVVTVLLQIISVIIDAIVMLKPVLMPIAIGMIVIGFIFAFLLPMLAYLYGFMMLLLFFVGVFLGAAVLPFYLVYKFINLDKEYQNGIQLLYRDFFGPYMTPILYVLSSVIAWSMMVIGLYLFNFGYSVLHEGLGASYAGQSGTIMGFIFNVMLYMLYFFGLFVYLRFLLQLMKSLTDKAKEKMNLAPSNDGQFMDSLGFENYVQARVVSDMAKGLSKLGRDMSREQARNMGFNSYAEMLAFKDQLNELVERNNNVMQQSGFYPEGTPPGGGTPPDGNAPPGGDTPPGDDTPPAGGEAPPAGEVNRQDEVPADQKSSEDGKDKDAPAGEGEEVTYSEGENPDGEPEQTHGSPKEALDKAEQSAPVSSEPESGGAPANPESVSDSAPVDQESKGEVPEPGERSVGRGDDDKEQ